MPHLQTAPSGNRTTTCWDAKTLGVRFPPTFAAVADAVIE
jgi:hypothetical protein